MHQNTPSKDKPMPDPADPNRNLVEHPQHPGVFYDPGLVYILTGDPAKDVAHTAMMIEHTYCLPQRVVIGG